MRKLRGEKVLESCCTAFLIRICLHTYVKYSSYTAQANSIQELLSMAHVIHVTSY